MSPTLWSWKIQRTWTTFPPTGRCRRKRKVQVKVKVTTGPSRKLRPKLMPSMAKRSPLIPSRQIHNGKNIRNIRRQDRKGPLRASLVTVAALSAAVAAAGDAAGSVRQSRSCRVRNPRRLARLRVRNLSSRLTGRNLRIGVEGWRHDRKEDQADRTHDRMDDQMDDQNGPGEQIAPSVPNTGRRQDINP
jgi:hypothetical protein